MSFSTVINLGTVSAAITKVKLSACTGSTCDNPVVITGYDNYDVWSGTQTISGIPDDTNYIKVEALGTCAGTIQCLLVTGKPGTPTPTPTATGTPTPTPTVTPTPTPTPTATTTSEGAQCYSYTVESSVDKNLYGIRYTGSGEAIVENKFSELEDDSNGVYSICCIGQPTLLQFSGNVSTGIGFAEGVSRTGPNGSCTSNADCFDGGTSEPITFSATPECVGYAPTGVTITINNASGGSGTGYYVVMTSPSGNNTPRNLPYAYTGLDNYVGNTYAFTVYDSEGTPSNNVALTQDFSCAAAPNNTAFANLVISSTKPTSAQCSSGTAYTFDLGSPSATFCNATRYTASGLTGLGTGNNYWLCYDGQTRQVFHPSNAGYFDTAGGCQTL